ncbi:hypothetical protein P5V15_015224 [Pogonomyrmex californicus]
MSKTYYNYRITLWAIIGTEEIQEKTLFEMKNFFHHPGLYFEEVGFMNQVQTTWKLVIKLDTTALRIRAQQLQDYLEQTDQRCKSIIGPIRFAKISCINTA